MSTIRRTATWMWLLGLLLTLLPAAHVDAARFYPVEALQPGLRGTGKTVMQGTTVETFEVEYIGVMKDAGPSGDLILVRVGGAAIERSGGIAAGMSGSPVYVGDQLVGAIGYGFDMADHRVGLVTPIGDMLDVLQLVPGNEGASTESPEGDPVRESEDAAQAVPKEVYFASSLADASEVAASVSPDSAVFAPVRTPILAAGFSSRALSDLADRLERFNFVPVVSGGAPDGALAPLQLEPGSAFGVELARGDVSLTSIGTVTYVEDDRFIGFGHPFTNRGPVEFVASSAYVHDVVQAASMPFKLGAPLAPVGTLLQDRGAAVAARLGPLPDMIPVTVSVYDADRDKTSIHQFEIVRDNEYTVALATSGGLALLDRSLDRLGRGTARIVFRIEGDGLERPLVRDNVFYSDYDIGALSLLEFMEAVSLVVNNRFQPVDVTRIHLSAHIEQERHTAHIEQARPDKTQVRPGDVVDIEVTLRPYREPPVTERLQIRIPSDAGPGMVTVEVRGGGWGLRPPVQEEDTILDDPEEALGETVYNLTRLIEEFTRRERNNELVGEFYSSRRRSANAAGDNRSEGVDGEGNGGWFETFPGGGWVVASLSTDYVLLGSQIFDLQILRPEEAESAPGDESDQGKAVGTPDDVSSSQDEQGPNPQGPARSDDASEDDGAPFLD